MNSQVTEDFLACFVRVLNISRYGTADRPVVSLKSTSFCVFTQMAYVLPGSSLTGQAYINFPRGSGTGRPSSRAVSIHSRITTSAFTTASWYVALSAG